MSVFKRGGTGKLDTATRRLLVNGSSHKGLHKWLNSKEIHGERRRGYSQTLRLIVRGSTHKKYATG